MDTPISVKAKSKSRLIAVIILVALIMVPLWIMMMSLSDVDAEHSAENQPKYCFAISERYYSPSRGTSLELCYPGEGMLWQGRICRITALDGQVILSRDEAYECVILEAKRSYWDGVIIRDGYGPFPPELNNALELVTTGGG